MSSSSQTLESSSHFKSILDAALSEYKSKTGNDLTNNLLAKELQACESAEAVLDIIQREANAFDEFRDGDKRLMKWIGPSVDVLYTISATLGQGVGMVFPAANVVSAGIGVLLVAAKGVKASHDVLVDLFERVQFFLKRLGVHTRITPTKDMEETLVTIMTEVLSILAIVTKEVQQSQTETSFGWTDTEDTLKRLDDLTQEVLQMATTQTLNHGANANLETELGETALHIVSRGEYYPQEQGVSTARLLLERGADVNARQNNGWTSLHWAAYKGRVEVAQVLLDHGANAKLKTTLGETVLHLVSRGEYYSQDHGAGITRLLLEHGVDLDVQNKFLDTALHWAADKGRLEITQLLLDHGANPNLASERGLRPLDIVVSNGQYNSQERAVDIAQLLLERGVDVNAPQKNGWTALHWAAFSGNVKAAQLLLDHGANANLETDKGETALHIVSQGEYDSQEQGVSTALLLLEHGVDVNARRKDGWTALHWAAYKGRVEVAQVLLDNGVNAKVEDREVKRRRTS